MNQKLNPVQVHAYSVPEEGRITIQLSTSHVDISLEAAQCLVKDLSESVERYQKYLEMKVRNNPTR